MLIAFVCTSSADLSAQIKRRKYKSKAGYKRKMKKPKKLKAGPNSTFKKGKNKSARGLQGGKRKPPGSGAHYVSLGATLGALNYKGDFDQSKSLVSSNLKGTRPGLGVHAVERLNENLSLRAQLFYGRIKGSDEDAVVNSQSDAYRRLRNLKFTNDILELKLDVMYDIIPARSAKFLKRTIFTPYVFAGVAVFTNNPKNNGHNLRKVGTAGQHLSGSDQAALENFYSQVATDYDFDPKIPEPYKEIQVAVPFGIGVRQKLNSHIDVSFEIGVRYTFTDYLDDLGDQTVFVGRDDRLTADLGLQGDLSTIYQLNDGYSASNSELFDIVEEYGIDSDQSFGTGQIKGGSRTNFLSKRDFYIFTGFKLSYVIGKAVVSSKF